MKHHPHPTQFLKEANGQLSSARLFAFLAVLGYMIEWMHWVFGQPTVFAPAPTTVGVVLGLVGAKVAQKFGEEKGAPDAEAKPE